jgi:hypothetical protein
VSAHKGPRLCLVEGQLVLPALRGELRERWMGHIVGGNGARGPLGLSSHDPECVHVMLEAMFLGNLWVGDTKIVRIITDIQFVRLQCAGCSEPSWHTYQQLEPATS